MSCLSKQSVGASWTWRCNPASLKRTNVSQTTHGIPEVRDTVIKRTNFITSYIASELDLVLRDVTAP